MTTKTVGNIAVKHKDGRMRVVVVAKRTNVSKRIQQKKSRKVKVARVVCR